MAKKGHQIVVKIEQFHDVMLVTPLGERLALVEVPIVFEQILKLCHGGKRMFVVDFSHVSWVTPSMPGILVDLTDKIGELGGEVRLAAMNEQAQATLDIFKIRDRFMLFDNADEAIASFGNGRLVRRDVYAQW
ncbi:MAG: STAS domain-containing protein [Planctomycetota bacterium]